MRRKRRGRRLNKTKIILTLFSGFLVYFAATILVMYSNKNHFFSCNLTTVIPYNGPWEKLDQLSSIDTTELKELFSQDYLFGEDLWITLGKIDNKNWLLFWLEFCSECLQNLPHQLSFPLWCFQLFWKICMQYMKSSRTQIEFQSEKPLVFLT